MIRFWSSIFPHAASTAFFRLFSGSGGSGDGSRIMVGGGGVGVGGSGDGVGGEGVTDFSSSSIKSSSNSIN